MKNYRLAIDGDCYEQKYWYLFIQNQFQSYEDFWMKNIVPLTNRPVDIHFKTDSELDKIGKTANAICIAQLHYSILRHLARVFDILGKGNIDLDNLTEGMARLCGAMDVAFELLERYQKPKEYDPWLDKKDRDGNGRNGSKEACKKWQKANKYPLQKLRDYRNHLIHGRMLPVRVVGNVCFLPKIESESKYFDWRKITDPNNHPGLSQNDLVPINDILLFAWSETIKYLNDKWKTVLLRSDNSDSI